jgi:hypothetical protein
MKTLHPLERNHVFCEICGQKMAAVEHHAPSRYDRKTGEEYKGSVSTTWECPEYKFDSRHDREVM